MDECFRNKSKSQKIIYFVNCEYIYSLISNTARDMRKWKDLKELKIMLYVQVFLEIIDGECRLHYSFEQAEKKNHVSFLRHEPGRHVFLA